MPGKEEPKSWCWMIENGLAMLHEGSNKPIPYSKDSLEMALRNIKSGRSYYATQEAWLKSVEKYEVGFATLLNAQKKQS